MFCDDNNSEIVKQNKILIVNNFEVIALHQYEIVRLNSGTEIFFHEGEGLCCLGFSDFYVFA